jgi:hypothetical protein
MSFSMNGNLQHGFSTLLKQIGKYYSIRMKRGSIIKLLKYIKNVVDSEMAERG